MGPTFNDTKSPAYFTFVSNDHFPVSNPLSISTMAYNPDALYGQPVGAPAKLPTASLPSMNEPGQAPRREKVAAALKKLLQLAASIPSSYNDHNLGHFGIAAMVWSRSSMESLQQGSKRK